MALYVSSPAFVTRDQPLQYPRLMQHQMSGIVILVIDVSGPHMAEGTLLYKPAHKIGGQSWPESCTSEVGEFKTNWSLQDMIDYDRTVCIRNEE